MITQVNILDKIHVLETIFRSGYQNDVIERTLDKIIFSERDKAIIELTELRNQLRSFEKKYKMASDNFYPRFQNGELGDDADFFEWSAFYGMYQSVSKRLANLEFKSV